MAKTANTTPQPNYPDQIISNKPQPGAEHAVNAAPISADLRRMAGAGAKSAPITLMTEDRACKWAWDQVREDVGTDGWTAGESCTFYGFFLWGWNYRGQYETQRPAAPTAPAGEAVPDERQAFEHYQCDRMRRDLQELTMHPDGRYDCDDIQAEWDVWQARAALAAAPAQAVAVPLAWKPLPENADERRMFSDATSVYGGDVRGQLASMLSSFASAYPRGSFGAQLAIMANEVAKLHLAPAQEHATQLAGQGHTAPSTRAGLLAAAAHIQAKASAHAEECGSYDPDTGAFEMRDAVQDHYNTLDELAEEIRLLADKAVPETCDKPPAGWACNRAPGHDGPCAAAPAQAQGTTPLTNERIRQLDDETKFHEAHDWSVRFARRVEAELKRKPTP